MPLLDLPNEILLLLFSCLPDPQTYRSLVLTSSHLNAIGTSHRSCIFLSIAQSLYDPALISLVYKHQTLSAYQALQIQRASHRIHFAEGVIYTKDHCLGRKKEWTSEEFMIAEDLDASAEDLVMELGDEMFGQFSTILSPSDEARLKGALFNIAGLMCEFHLKTRLEDLPVLSDEEWGGRGREQLMRVAIMSDDELVQWEYDYTMWMEMGIREMADVLALGRFLGMLDWEGISMVREWWDHNLNPLIAMDDPLLSTSMAGAHLKRVFIMKVAPGNKENLSLGAIQCLINLMYDPFGCPAKFEKSVEQAEKWNESRDQEEKRRYLDSMFERKEVDQWNAYEGRYEKKNILVLRKDGDDEDGWGRMHPLDKEMLKRIVDHTDKSRFWNSWDFNGSSDEDSDSDSEDSSDLTDSDEDDSELSDSDQTDLLSSSDSSSDDSTIESESSSDDSDSSEDTETELVWQG